MTRSSIDLILLFAVVACVSLVLRNGSPLFKYWLWFIVIVRLIVPPFLNIPGLIREALSQLPIGNRVAENTSLSTVAVTYDKTLSALRTVVPANTDFTGTFGIIWFCCAGLLVLLFLTSFIQIERAARKSSAGNHPEIQRMLDELLSELGIKRNVQLVIGDIHRIKSPGVYGIFHPKILLPYSVVESISDSEMKTVLVHELVHIRQHDQVMNIIQILVQIVYFFHPLVWIVNGKIRGLREEVCDDISVHLLNNEKKQYSRSIISVLESLQKEPLWGFADVSFSERRHNLSSRLLRLLSDNYRFYRKLNAAAISALVLFAAFSLTVSCENFITASDNPVPTASKPAQGDPDTFTWIKVEVYFLENGNYTVNDEEIVLADLEETIRETYEKEKKENTKLQVISYPFPETTQKELWDVMKACYHAGARRVSAKQHEAIEPNFQD